MERYDFTLNVDVRDQVVFGEPYNEEKYSGGIRHYKNLDISKLKELNEGGYLDLQMAQNFSPTVGEFFNFMTKYPQVTCHGYVVSPFRSDYRFSIEGLSCNKDINEDLIKDFTELCEYADDFVVKDDELFSWWD